MSLRQIISASIAEYLDSTTIHGLAYLIASRNIIEKLAWFGIILTCFTLAGLLISQGIEEAEENPIITSIETIPVQEIIVPFSQFLLQK